MARRSKRGGFRPGSGQKPGPPDKVRSERVVVMLTPPELKELKKLAIDWDLPLGTAAYKVLAKGLPRPTKRRAP